MKAVPDPNPLGVFNVKHESLPVNLFKEIGFGMGDIPAESGFYSLFHDQILKHSKQLNKVADKGFINLNGTLPVC